MYVARAKWRALSMIRFGWGVPEDGFQWVETRGALRFLTPGFTLNWRRYNPFRDTPALFLTFGDLDLTEAAILAFANLYGALGKDEMIELPDGRGSRGERIETWTAEIVAMAHMLRVWNALKARDQSALERWFHLEGQKSIVHVSYTPDDPWPPGVDMGGMQYITGEIEDHVRYMSNWGGRGDESDEEIPPGAAGWALDFLHVQINVRLQNHTSASLQYTSESHRSIPLSLYIVPKNLLGALWLQLALAIEENRQYRRCSQCQGWFEVAAKARRPSTTYCSPRCRLQAYRGRQSVKLSITLKVKPSKEKG